MAVSTGWQHRMSFYDILIKYLLKCRTEILLQQIGRKIHSDINPYTKNIKEETDKCLCTHSCATRCKCMHVYTITNNKYILHLSNNSTNFFFNHEHSDCNNYITRSHF